MAPDNANPTILTASQLPTRQLKKKNKAASKQPVDKYYEIVTRKPAYEPFSNLPWSDDTDSDEGFAEEPIDEQEIYDLISSISDPEHPLTLGQLAVVNLPDIHITPPPSAVSSDPNTLTRVLVKITPTVSHCSMATVLGLGVRVRLEQALPPNYRVDIEIKEDSHNQDDQVNKQLADKERVAAALENDNLKAMINEMLKTCY